MKHEKNNKINSKKLKWWKVNIKCANEYKKKRSGMHMRIYNKKSLPNDIITTKIIKSLLQY